MNKNKAFLSRIPLFRGLDEQTRENLLAEIPWREREFPRGSTILHQGDLYEDPAVIVRGESYAEMIDPGGKVIRIEEFRPPCLFAPAVLFSSRPVMPGSVVTLSDSLVLSLKKENLLRLCALNSRVLENLLGLISDKFVFLSHRMSFLSFRTIREKVLFYLQSLGSQPGRPVRLPLSMEELAAFFGVTRPALSRVFAELEEEGVIRKNRREVEVLGSDKKTC